MPLPPGEPGTSRRPRTWWARRRAMAVFVIQMPGTARFRASARRDLAFVEALSQAAGAGVKVFATGCEVGPRACFRVSLVAWTGKGDWTRRGIQGGETVTG
ncbi:MAG: DNA/RNA nuclease SfsA [Bacillota bacterium]